MQGEGERVLRDPALHREYIGACRRRLAYDAEAAGKIGLRTIGVLCGGFPEQDLCRAGCVAIYRDPAECSPDEVSMLGQRKNRYRRTS